MERIPYLRKHVGTYQESGECSTIGGGVPPGPPRFKVTFLPKPLQRIDSIKESENLGKASDKGAPGQLGPASSRHSNLLTVSA